MPDAYPAHDLPSERPPHHTRTLPLWVATRGSPLALAQTRPFLALLAQFFPVLAPGMVHDPVFEQHVIRTTGNQGQDRSPSDIGGKRLFSREIHEARLDRRIDFAVHSLKDLETGLPPGVRLTGAAADPARLGTTLGTSRRRDSPRDIFG